MIVPAMAAHAEALAAIHAACFPPPERWGAEAFAGLLSGPGGIGFVAEDGGGCILARRAADEADILTLAVMPECRRAGLGRALVDRLVQACGDGRVFLEVGVGNLAAIGLYEGAGFRRVGMRRGYYADGSDALLLSRTVIPDGSGSR